GFTWCVLQAFYEYLILLKVWEIRHEAVPTAEAMPADAQPEAHKTAQSKAA
ncbi:MAG: glycosyltransferase family 2 protein, partial [Cyanobacteria bacterium J06649_5]